MTRKCIAGLPRRNTVAVAVLTMGLGALLPTCQRATADEDTVDRLLPATTAVYLAVPDPDGLVDSLWNHPARQRAMKIDGVEDAMKMPQYLQFRAVVSVVEAQLAVTWREALKIATSKGIHVAIDAETEGLVLLSQADDAASRDRILNKIIQMARDDAERKGEDDPYETREYRGVTAYKADDLVLASFGSWLMATNKGELGKKIIDAFHDGASTSSLSELETYQQAQASIEGTPAAWGMINLKLIRDSGGAKELFRDKTENILAEMLFGGIQSRLLNAPLATIALRGQNNEARLEVAVHRGQDSGDEVRQYYFGAGGGGRSPALLQVEQTLLAVSMYRDLAQMWLRSGDLLSDRAVDELNEADSNLTNLFAGKDFGEDILGALEPGVQLVVARQDFKNRLPQPAVKLPSLAIVMRLKDPVGMRPELRRTFQSLIGFLNVAVLQTVSLN